MDRSTRLREDYLAEVRRQCRALPADLRDRLVSEINEDVEALFRVRLWRGCEVEQAEREAQAILGEPVRSLTRVRRSQPSDRWLQAIPFVALLSLIPSVAGFTLDRFPTIFLPLSVYVTVRSWIGNGNQVDAVLKSWGLTTALGFVFAFLIWPGGWLGCFMPTIIEFLVLMAIMIVHLPMTWLRDAYRALTSRADIRGR